MEKTERELILKDYFDLIVFLNRGNKTVNQKTKLDFSIVGDKLFAYLKPLGSPRIILVAKDRRQAWLPSNLSKYVYLEAYIAKTMRCYNKDHLRHLRLESTSLLSFEKS